MIPLGLSRRSENASGPVVRINVVAVAILLGAAAAGVAAAAATGNRAWIVSAVLIGLLLMQSPRVALQWERAVVLRLGPVHRTAAARACSGSCRSSIGCRRGSTSGPSPPPSRPSRRSPPTPCR